jgi:tetratricopeptide (TPR) repeat protein
LRWLRPVVFGVLWFFLTLSIEASLVSLNMLMHEYRVYLPSVGILLVLAVLVVLGLDQLSRPRLKLALGAFAFVLVPALLASVAFARNEVWRTEIGLWEDVVRKSPGDPRGHNALGLLYYNNEGRKKEGLQCLETAARLAPGFIAASNNLGNMYRKERRFKDAVRMLNHVLRLKEDQYEAHYNLGLTWRQLGEMDKAITHFKRALELRPDLDKAMSYLGRCYAKKGMADQAVDYFEKALAFNRDIPEAHTYLGSVALKAGEMNKAEQHLARAAELMPNNAKTAYNLGVVYLKQHNYGDARELFAKAIKLDPSYEPARRALKKLAMITAGEVTP